MKIKLWVILVFLVAAGGGIVLVMNSNEKPKRSSDFFKNEAKDIDVTDGKKF